MDAQTTIRPSTRAVFRELVDGGGVLLNLDTAGYHGLNPIGTIIWTLLDGGTRFADLVAELRRRIQAPPPNLEDDIAEFLEGLADRNLVMLSPGSQGEPGDGVDGPRPG